MPGQPFNGWVIRNRYGNPYTRPGWHANWKRWKKRIPESQRLTFQEIRIKAISEAEGSVLDNDLSGADYSSGSGDQIDPSTLEIMTQLNYGTATVDSVTGVIRYTADAHNGFSPLVDAFYYRVKNLVGDASNAGKAEITIESPG
jgi:hypothetical protein